MRRQVGSTVSSLPLDRRSCTSAVEQAVESRRRIPPMKEIERLTLIDLIGRELQSRMTYSDIRTYLQAFGVQLRQGGPSSFNSKWVYVKELLGPAPAATVIKIADELGLAHGYTVTPGKEVVDSSFWLPLHFKLFLTHLSNFKAQTAGLQNALRSYGISGFVAHVDIEPTRQWQDEIETALYSMDALAAILMPGFKESNWTDQEVGFAMGRGVLVIPIIRGLDPYGFIGKFQGVHVQGQSVAQVAKKLFTIIVNSPRTRSRMLTCLVDTTLQATSPDEALEKLGLLEAIPDLPGSYLKRLRDGAAAVIAFAGGKPLARLNKLLISRGLSEVPTAEGAAPVDDVPF